ncbi:glycosyltransferase family 4 protein [Cerasicoccus fimbriatus]|uniref:glycosyltransferase family 4 protein n=1 Tax=Cerasicoccus fimbriatus TaxID=3014554 RepID=UPI0022B4F756|nr:glycosyltransferase family 4 protein [Cerasicoccus sp. TK19100]
MILDLIQSKYTGYKKLAAHKLAMRSHRKRTERQRRQYEAWKNDTKKLPPDVIIGANLKFGGIRNHIQAIHRYTSHRCDIIPSEKYFPDLNDLTQIIREELVTYCPTGVRCIHSHVFPWMMQWGMSAQKHGIRWVHTYHNNYFPDSDSSAVEPWQQEINDALLNLAPSADIRLSVAKWQRDEYRENHGISTFYLPNGVDVENCDQGRAERFRKKFGLSRYLLYVGRNESVKNPAEFALLAKAMPQRNFVMAGPGLSAEILRKDYGVEAPENLQIIGALDHQGVQDAIAGSDGVIVTSKREGLPTLILEAMTHQKPIVAPIDKGCLEAISHGQYGFAYTLGDIDDLARKVEASLKDNSRGKAARERVLKEYDWRRIAEKLDFIYMEKDLRYVREKLAEWEAN